MKKRELLIRYRGERTQEEMALLYGVTQQTWSNWETGESKPPIHLMKKLEQDSGYPMEELFYDVFNKNKLLNT